MSKKSAQKRLNERKGPIPAPPPKGKPQTLGSKVSSNRFGYRK